MSSTNTNAYIASHPDAATNINKILERNVKCAKSAGKATA